MKLLLDENILRRIVPALDRSFPETSQVAMLGLERASDRQVWPYAKSHGYVLVSKDKDFRDLQAAWGFPPKIIQLTMGNCSSQAIARALNNASKQIEQALAEEAIGLIELY